MSTGANAKLYLANPDPEPDFADTLAFLDEDAILDWADWTETCPVDVNLDGGTETGDFSDRCNPDAEVVTKTTKEITFNFRKKKDPNDNALPNWVVWLKDAWHSAGADNLYVLMMDEDKDTEGSDGYWMIATVTSYSENQPLEEGIDISVTLRPSGNTTFQNFDTITRPITVGP